MIPRLLPSEFHWTAHQSIALELFYQKSFQAISIRLTIHPQFRINPIAIRQFNLNFHLIEIQFEPNWTVWPKNNKSSRCRIHYAHSSITTDPPADRCIPARHSAISHLLAFASPNKHSHSAHSGLDQGLADWFAVKITRSLVSLSGKRNNRPPDGSATALNIQIIHSF